MINNFIKTLLVIVFTGLFNITAYAVPVSLYKSYAGNMNFVGTEATRRTQSNTGNACAVIAATTTNTTTITGIPAGATITAAHLYWAGSYSTQTGSTRTAPDYTVTFEGSSITAPASRQYTANFTSGGYNLDFYSGVANVTPRVTARANPNGSYSFSGLSVNTATPHCTPQAVLAGWSLVIVYEAASEDLRIVNLYEGYEIFRGSSITLTPSNFKIPVSPINGKFAQLTWEGDSSNSATLNGFSEQLSFNGSVLTDASNPANNQFNSISTILSTLPSTGTTDTASYGVDFDSYSVNSLLSAGQTSASTTYSSGGDLVILSMEILSITNTPISDLAVSKTASSSFNVGSNATYAIIVNNAGPNIEPGNVVVTDTLPAGLSYISATGTDWNCNAVGQNVTCTRTGNLAVGANTSTITLTVAIAAAASPSVSNTANVSGTNFDNVTANNSSTATTTVNSAPSITLQKTSLTLSDPVNGASNPKAIPGALAEYSIKATNSGLSATDNNSIFISDAIPANTALYVNDISGIGSGPVRFVDGTPPSGLSYIFLGLGNTTDGLSFSNDGGATYVYVPSPDANGVDTNVTNIRISTLGQFLASGGAGDPSFRILFRVKIQ